MSRPAVDAAADAPMLRRWSDNLKDRRVIERFLDWCSDEQRAELAEWKDGSNWPSPYPGGAQKLLDLYHEIDQQQLDRERVALLNAARESSK